MQNLGRHFLKFLIFYSLLISTSFSQEQTVVPLEPKVPVENPQEQGNDFKMNMGSLLFQFDWNFLKVSDYFPSPIKLNATFLYQETYQEGLDYEFKIEDLFSMAPLLGLEYEIPFGPGDVNYFLGFNFGYQFSNGDNFKTGKCDYRQITLACSGVTALPFIGISFSEYMQLQLTYKWFPEYKRANNKNGLLVQFALDL